MPNIIVRKLASRSSTPLLILPQAISFTLLIVRLGLGLSAFGNGGASTLTAQFKSVVSMLSSLPTEHRSRNPAGVHNCQCGRGANVQPIELEVHMTQGSSVDFLESGDNNAPQARVSTEEKEGRDVLSRYKAAEDGSN